MDLKLYSNNLTDIYMVSNTPLYLFEAMRRSSAVSYLSQKNEDELISEFDNRINVPITLTNQIAELYAIVIALTYKNSEKVDTFFEGRISTIKFEWFSKIAEYYFSNKSNETSIFNIPNQNLKDTHNTIRFTVS